MTSLQAVLPLTLRDVARAEILLRSLEVNFPSLGMLWVVVPDAQREPIAERLASAPQTGRLKVVRETQIAPELRIVRTLGGWYRQQLIKLAIAEHVESDVYLTLDADVICTRPVTQQDLAPNGKPLCYVIPEDLHPLWYSRTQALLGMKAPRSGILHNVTPAVLARRAVLELRDYFQKKPLAFDVRGAKQALALIASGVLRDPRLARWRLLLAAGAPWTEYALYYTFLEATGRFEHYHTLADRAIYDVERSRWYAHRDDFDSWDPAECFLGTGAPWFLIVQSNTKIAPDRVWQRVAPYLAGRREQRAL